MSKIGIFIPLYILESNFSFGRQSAQPEGIVRYPDRDEVLMLDYKYLGIKYTQARHVQCRPRQVAQDVANNWGHKWRWSKEDWADFEQQIEDISDPLVDHHDRHAQPRCWRKE